MTERSVNESTVERSEADQWISRLKMECIDLGGYFGEGFRGCEDIPSAALPTRFGGDRRFYSSNYFLLKAGQVLGLHMLNQDELWFFNQGGPIQLYIFSTNGVYRTVTVGSNQEQGEALQAVAPHSHWFGAELPGAELPATELPSGLLPSHWRPSQTRRCTRGKTRAFKASAVRSGDTPILVDVVFLRRRIPLRVTWISPSMLRF